MSNVTSGSSGTSKAMHRGLKIPKRCWCGASVVAKLSKSEANPYRRYYQCVFAASSKLVDDKHLFKWVEDTLVNEIELLSNAIGQVENEVKAMASFMEDHQRIVMEKVESDVFEKVQELIRDAK